MSNKILVVLILIASLYSCSKDKDSVSEINPEVIKSYNNEVVESTKIDSTQAVELILKQKLQEVYDLATLRQKNDTDTLLFQQIASYFYDKDSIKVLKLLNEFDSINVKRVSLYDIESILDSTYSDSLGRANFKVNYHLKKKKFVESKDIQISYLLKRVGDMPNALFQFYFYDWDISVENDTISSGVTQ